MARVLRRLLTPRWLGAVVAACLVAWVCVLLGQWQWGRHVYKVERNARMDAHYDAAPVPLNSVIDAAPLPLDRQWTHVRTTGAYAAGTRQVYVRNRPNQGENGYEILAVFALADGRHVLVDRGWVQSSQAGAEVLPPVPPPPAGPVTLTGWAQRGEDSLGRQLPAGQLASINLPEAATAFGVDLLGGYVVLEHEQFPSGSLADRPAPTELPERSLGPHQAYAYQWWLTTPIGFVLIFFGIRRELRAEDPKRAPAPKKKKARIWDEEDG